MRVCTSQNKVWEKIHHKEQLGTTGSTITVHIDISPEIL